MTDAALARLVAADAATESAVPVAGASLDLAGHVRAAVARVLGFAEWLVAMLVVEAIVLLVAIGVSAAF
jgi:hypothetical protein